MKKNLWRMAIALIISSSCFVGTIVWFNSGKGEALRGDRKPMARLSDSNNEVQRKPLQRVIWESVNKNDELYSGEAIRTAPNADARLFFIKSGAMVHLEPDSLVVLEENDKGLSLDFLQGNLFVQSTKDGTDGNGLTLKTGNGGEITLKSADMSLSKNQNGHVNLEVHRGEAELSQGTTKTSLNREKSAELSDQGVSVAKDRMQVLRPLAGETLYLNLTRGEKLDLTWTPLSSAYSVGVEVGNSRGSMQKMAGMKSGGESGKLNIPSKPGRWFLRLIATSEDPKLPQMASTVIPFIIEPKSPPSLVEPRTEAMILRSEPDAVTTFKWLARNHFTSQVVEVAGDSQFKNVILHENLSGEAVSHQAKLADGKYFWRVTGFLKLKGKTESLSSPAGQFTMLSKWEIKAPTLLAPTNEQHLSFLETQKSGVALKWKPSQAVERLKISVESKAGETWKSVIERETENSSLRVSDLQPGLYRWRVGSIDSKSGEIKNSDHFHFTIEDLPKIEWVGISTTGEVDYEYETPTPTLRAHWKPLASAESYRFKASPEGGEVVNWQNTKQNLFDTPLPADGRFQVLVEAMNGKGQVIAQSDLRTFVVKRRPLLPAPQWTSNTPEVLTTDGKGNLTFAWQQVQGAQNYLMILEGPDGKIEQREISRTTASLNRLKPGHYQVHLKAVDEFKRPGTDGDARKIEVSTTSDIRAPKIKAMKVK